MQSVERIIQHLDIQDNIVLGQKEGFFVEPRSWLNRQQGSFFFSTAPEQISLSEIPEHSVIVLPFTAAPREKDIVGKAICTILTEEPRTTFFDLVNAVFTSHASESFIDPSAVIAEGVSLGRSIHIGAHVSIGPNTVIGDNCVIRSGARILGKVKIGNHCRIKSNSVIGDEGYGLYRNRAGLWQSIPHTGGVVIGNHVVVGALNTICSGTLDPTVIGDYTTLDDHIHVAHNCQIGRNVVVTACAELSGSVTIEDEVWIGPQVAIMNKVTIGARALIGLGAVVTKDVTEGMIVAGNPAKPIRPRGSHDG